MTMIRKPALSPARVQRMVRRVSETVYGRKCTVRLGCSFCISSQHSLDTPVPRSARCRKVLDSRINFASLSVREHLSIVRISKLGKLPMSRNSLAVKAAIGDGFPPDAMHRHLTPVNPASQPSDNGIPATASESRSGNLSESFTRPSGETPGNVPTLPNARTCSSRSRSWARRRSDCSSVSDSIVAERISSARIVGNPESKCNTHGGGLSVRIGSESPKSASRNA